jgi:CheY-like chemotaxis protein
LRKLATHATVLIVEHEFTNRMLMEKILDIGGYHCVMASNGQEALAVFERERPDLVLTDVSMPIMDGLAATAALRARPEGKHVPIIAVSGHALREDREHALRQGCTEYLVKPYRPHDLLALVARLLRTERG